MVLADQSCDNIQMAKMLGLSTYWGNVVSAHADRNIDLIGIVGLLAITPSDDLNVLAARHFRSEFGAKNTYSIRKTTPLTDEFTYEDYLMQNQGKHIPMFAIDAGENVYPMTADSNLSPKADWKIIGVNSMPPLSTDPRGHCYNLQLALQLGQACFDLDVILGHLQALELSVKAGSSQLGRTAGTGFFATDLVLKAT